MSVALDSTAGRTAINGSSAGATAARLADVDSFTELRFETGLAPEDVGNMEHSYDDIELRPSPAEASRAPSRPKGRPP